MANRKTRMRREAADEAPPGSPVPVKCDLCGAECCVAKGWRHICLKCSVEHEPFFRREGKGRRGDFYGWQRENLAALNSGGGHCSRPA